MDSPRILAEPGDILLYRISNRSGLLFRAIVFFQRLWGEGSSDKKYYHCSVVASNTRMQFEARWPRCRESEIDWSNPGLELWRVRDIVEPQARAIVSCALNMSGEWYDVGQFLFGALDFKHAEICSTFVAKAVAASGVDIVPMGDRFFTPNEVAESYNLTRIA